jgi:hypothetical protein
MSVSSGRHLVNTVLLPTFTALKAPSNCCYVCVMRAHIVVICNAIDLASWAHFLMVIELNTSGVRILNCLES